MLKFSFGKFFVITAIADQNVITVNYHVNRSKYRNYQRIGKFPKNLNFFIYHYVGENEISSGKSDIRFKTMIDNNFIFSSSIFKRNIFMIIYR